MATEIESRYLVPDRIIFDKLLKLEALGGYTLQPQGKLKLCDRYLDTKGRALLRQGWACRLRSQEGAWLLTVKGPRNAQGAVMSRPEWEVSLPGRIESVSEWPVGPIRDRVRELSGNLPLRPIATIKQTRHRFLLSQAARPVAELALDVVRLSDGGARQQYYMLECELLETGQPSDLQQLHEILVRQYYLIPETRSKLQHALEFVELGTLPDAEQAQAPRPMSVEDLQRRYDADAARAARVTEAACLLFERLLPIHQLPETGRELLRMAALLYNIGEAGGRGNAHAVGRDILLRQPIAGLDTEDQRVVAAAIYLQRKKITPQRIEEAFPQALSPQQRREALAIAALLRLASLFDAPAPRGTRIQAVEVGDAAIQITLAGPRAARDVKRAGARSDLWGNLYGTIPIWRALEPLPEPSAQATVGAPRKTIGIEPQDSVADAVRKVLRFHFNRMLEHEEGARQGKDPEEVHDMRVATRRMRSVFSLLGPYLTGPQAIACRNGLRRLGQLLGAVRDMDVALIKLREYVEALPPAQRRDHGPLFAAWRAQRRVARHRLIGYLSSLSYRRFVQDLEALIQSAHDAQPRPDAATEQPVVTMAPRYIHVRWQVTKAYGAILEDAPIELLHALRIDAKRLRYMLEFFADVLPAEAVSLIPEVIALQDHLGALQDAAVTGRMIDDLLAQHADLSSHGGIGAYRQVCRQEMARLLATFPDAWARFMRELSPLPRILSVKADAESRSKAKRAIVG